MNRSLPQRRSLTEMAFWLTFAKTVAFALNFALPLLLVRRLSQADFGLYKQAFLLIAIAVAVLPLGFGMSAFYFFPRRRDRQGEAALHIVLFHVLVGGLACLALLLWPGMLGAALNSAEMAGYAPLIGLVILLWTTGAFLEIVAIAREEVRLSTLFIVASQLSKTVLLVGAALLAGSIRALLIAAAAQGAMQTAGLLIFLNRRFPGFWRKPDAGLFRAQLSYALPLGLAGLVYTLQADLHNFLVAHQFGAAQYAIYAVGVFQLPLVAILRESANSVLIPRVSVLQQEAGRRDILELIARAMRKLAAVYFPLYALLLIAGRDLIEVLFTRQYVASWPIFAINLTLLPFAILVLDPVLRAYAEQRYFVLKARVVLFVLMTAALWFGLRHVGLVGAIVIVVAGNLVERFVIAWRVGRLLKVGRRDAALFADLGKVAGAALLGALAAAAARGAAGDRPTVGLLVCGAAFCAAYGLAVLLLRVLTSEERAAIRGQLARLRRATWKRAADASA